MTDKLALTEQERNSPLWLRIKAHYEARLALLRMQNDTDKPEIQTARLRGRILACKELLALDNPAPAPLANDE